MQATAARPAKPAYKPTVKLVNIHTGAYLVKSSDGATWYAVNVASPTCTCKAGQNGFKNCARQGGLCKHLIAAKLVAKAIHDSRQPAPVAPAPRPTQRTCAGCGAVYFGTQAAGWCSCRTAPAQAEPIDLAARRAARPAFVPAIAELSELFG